MASRPWLEESYLKALNESNKAKAAATPTSTPTSSSSSSQIPSWLGASATASNTVTTPKPVAAPATPSVGGVTTAGLNNPIRDPYGNWVENDANYANAIRNGTYVDPFPNTDSFARDWYAAQAANISIPGNTYSNQADFSKTTLEKMNQMAQQKILNEGYVRRGEMTAEEAAKRNALIDQYTTDLNNKYTIANNLRAAGLSSDPMNIEQLRAGTATTPTYSLSQQYVMNAKPIYTQGYTPTYNPIAPQNNTTTYVWKPGDNIDTLARQYGTTANEIYKLNNISNPSSLYAGANLKVPVAQSSSQVISKVAPQQTAANITSPNMTLADWAAQNGINVSYDNGQVNIVNPYNGQKVTFAANQGEQYGISDVVNGRHGVANSQLLSQILGMNQPMQQQQYYQPSAEQSEIDSLVQLLRSIGMSNGVPDFYSLSYDEASDQAGNELNPEYDIARKELMRTTDIDLEKRGIYNAPLASGITTEKLADFETGRQSTIAKRAGEIQSQSQEQAYRQQQLYLQDRAQRTDALASLLNTLSNRQLTQAQLTGVLNGVKTLAAQQLDADIAFKQADLTGYYNGNPTMDREKFDLDQKEFDLSKYKVDFESAINRLNSLGYVSTDADAALLGVTRGTQSFQAKEAVAERQAAMDRLDKQLSAQAAIAAADRQAANQRAAADNALASFNKDLAIWELTGKAPDSVAMRSYGIAPGTAWVPKATDQLNNIKLDEAQKAQNQVKIDQLVDGYAGTLLSVKEADGYDYATCEAIATIIINNPTQQQAMNAFNANKQALAKEGVDVGKVKSGIEETFRFGNAFVQSSVLDMKRAAGAQ